VITEERRLVTVLKEVTRLAHKVSFTIPEKELLHKDIRIVVHRDIRHRKTIPAGQRPKGKLGELLVSQAGIEWTSRGKSFSKSWLKFANWIEN
jgi:hypothetical protein